MITAIIVIMILYILLNNYLIYRKNNKAEILVQIISFLSAIFLALFGAKLYFTDPYLSIDGLLFIITGLVLFIGHVNSAKYGYKGW